MGKTARRTHHRSPCADRLRPDRRLHRAPRARIRAPCARSSPRPRARSEATRKRVDRTRHRRPRGRDECRGRRRTPTSSSSASRSARGGPVAKEIAGALKPGAIVSDVGSVKNAGAQGYAAAYRRRAHLDPGASGGRHRELRPGLRLRRVVREPLVHPHPAGRRGRRKRSRSCARSGPRSGRTSRP